MEDLVDPEEMILCPYNKSHYIRRSKMPFHLVKCKKSYTGPSLFPCDFNATHLMEESELRNHHRDCPDRRLVEFPVVASQQKNENRFPIPKLDIAVDESWDDEDVPTYDPKTYTENSNVLRRLDVESKAKKREFRLNERKRLNALNTNTTDNLPRRPNLPPHRSIINVDTSGLTNLQENKENVGLEGEECSSQSDN